MFPKSVSGTSGELRENKGDEMAEITAAEKARHRINFGDMASRIKKGTDMDFQAGSEYAESIIWASERITELEAETPSREVICKGRDAFFSLGIDRQKATMICREAIAWGQNRVRELEIENENLRKTILVLSNSPPVASQESGEEVHQRRRKERMLDEVTVILMRDKIEQMRAGIIPDRQWGRNSRDTADNICHGINEFDAAQ